VGRQRSYSDSTLAALYALAQGTCYWPDPPCDQPIVDTELAKLDATGYRPLRFFERVVTPSS
jgi:hypothetical protein